MASAQIYMVFYGDHQDLSLVGVTESPPCRVSVTWSTMIRKLPISFRMIIGSLRVSFVIPNKARTLRLRYEGQIEEGKGGF